MSTDSTQSTDGLPDSFDAFTRVCIDCGDVVERVYLENGRCVGCQIRGDDRHD